MEWLAANYITVLNVVTGIVAGASVALHAISVATKNTKDDRWAARAAKAKNFLEKLALNRKA